MSQSQRGATLFEGLIAMLLMGIVGVGITYVLSRSALSQTTVNAQNVVINQARAQLQSSNAGMSSFCGGGTTPTPVPIQLNASGTAVYASSTVACTMAAATVTVAGGTAKTVFLPQITFSTSASDNTLLGGSSANGSTSATLVITNNGS